MNHWKPRWLWYVWKFWMLHRCTLCRSWDKNISHVRSYRSIYMFTLRICSKMTKSEKPPPPGVALLFGEVMKKVNYSINWQGNVSFWARLCNYNYIQSSIKLTGLSMTRLCAYHFYWPLSCKVMYLVASPHSGVCPVITSLKCLSGCL